MKNLALAVFFIVCILSPMRYAKAQGMGINALNNSPHASAGLDVDFTNKGMLVPRVSLSSTADVSTIPNPAASLLVYNDNATMTDGTGKGYYYYDGSAWKPLSVSGGSSGQLLMSNGTGAPSWTTATYPATAGANGSTLISDGTNWVSTVPPSSSSDNFGSGEDGDTIIEGEVTLTRDMFYNNLTVNGTLITDAYRIFVKNTITGTGTIKWGTPNAGGGGNTGGSGNAGESGGGGSSGSGMLKSVGGGNGMGGRSTAGTTGGSPGNAFNVSNNAPNVTECLGSAGANGGQGGRGQSGSSAPNYSAGGGGGSATPVNTKFGVFRMLTSMLVDLKSDYTFGKLTVAGGAAGGGMGGDGSSSSASGGGGGGGASGGIIFIVANTWSGTFTIENKGASGGNGSSPAGNAGTVINCGGGGGGGGGAGGINIIVYETKTWTGTHVLTGGTGGIAGPGGQENAVNGTDGATGVAYEVKSSTLM